MSKYSSDVSSEDWKAPDPAQEPELEKLAFQMWVYMSFSRKPKPQKPSLILWERWNTVREDYVCRRYFDAAHDIRSGKHISFLDEYLKP